MTERWSASLNVLRRRERVAKILSRHALSFVALRVRCHAEGGVHPYPMPLHWSTGPVKSWDSTYAAFDDLPYSRFLPSSQ